MANEFGPNHLKARLNHYELFTAEVIPKLLNENFIDATTLIMNNNVLKVQKVFLCSQKSETILNRV